MKKVLFSLIAFAAIAVSCTVEPKPVDEPTTDGVKFSLNVLTTKTVADGVATKWVAGDQINVFNAPQNGTFTGQGAFEVSEENVATGTFEGTIAPLEADVYDWVAVYPYAEANTDLSALTLTIADDEAALSTTVSLAGENIPLVGAATGVEKDEAVSIRMSHLTSGIALKVVNDNEEAIAVSEIVLTFPAAVAGEFTVDASDLDAIAYTASATASNTITLTAAEAVSIAAGASATFYAPIAPVTIADGGTLAYEINGTEGTLTATKDIKFTAGSIKPITVKAPEVVALPTDLSANGTANCYIVSAAGDYCFNATVKGNGASGIHSTFTTDTNAAITPAGAKLVWTEVAGLVSDITYDNGKIYFTATGATGNAVIAATNAEGTILWSWHIWSGYTLSEVVVNDENMAGYVYGFLSRNLGASSDTNGGLYYQWGRKDPFSAILAFDSASGAGKYHPVTSGDTNHPEEVVNTIAYANAHPIEYLAKSSRNNDWLLEYPQRYLWGINQEIDQNPNFSPFGKTIYDPCPVGYSVATPTSMANTTVAKNSDGSFTMYGGQIYVPAAGFVYNGGYGWYGQTSTANLWTCSTSWENFENAFRRTDSDGRAHYDRACGIPVRCFRNAK